MQTIYSIDYLNSLTMNELYNIAKKYPHFSTEKISKGLDISRENTYTILKLNHTKSKHVSKIRESLISYICKAQSYKYTANDLYRQALIYRKLTYTDISKVLKCTKETVSKMINGDEGNRRIFELKDYLNDVIEKGKITEDKVAGIIKNNQSNWIQIEEELQKEKDSLQKTLKKHTELLTNKDKKDFYNYLNSLSTIELCDLAKEYSNFRFAKMEQALGLSNGGVRQAARAKTSKFTESIRAYLIDFLMNTDSSNYASQEELNLKELFEEVKKYRRITQAEIADAVNCGLSTVHMCKTGRNKGNTAKRIKSYLESIINEYKSKDSEIKDVKEDKQMSKELNLEELFNEANNYQKITNKKIAEDLGLAVTTVSAAKTGKTNGKAALQVKEYLEKIIEQNKQVDELFSEINKVAQEEAKEQETMTEETLTDTKEMKTYDEFLNFINSQKELPIVKKALDEVLSENQNLDKILAKEEFITIETAQELNEKIFANEYTETEIIDFENQYYGTANDDSLKDKIKSFVEKHNLSLETALKLLQISEEDYNKLLEGADKISNKSADKIYKAISAFDEFYHSENTQNTINNTKDTFVTGIAIASAKGQTILNKGLNKFADFLNKSADKIKKSNSDNKEE